MLSIALLVGIWTTTCIQTQIINNSGYVKETYSIQSNGSYEFQREWFLNSSCTEPSGTDSETGTIELGERVQSPFFVGQAYKANFSSQRGTDLGAVSLQENEYLKVARGNTNSSIRNTMIGLFKYFKQ